MIPKINHMRFVLGLFSVFVFILNLNALTKEDALYVLKNHKEKGFYFEGEVSSDTYKVIYNIGTNSEKVFINFAQSRFGGIVNFYSTVMVLDKKPSQEMMESLLRLNNFNESLGFFYLYYDVSMDKWFVDYSVRMRQEDLTKTSLISIIKIVAMYSLSSRRYFNTKPINY